MSDIKYAEGTVCKFVFRGCGIILDSCLDTSTTTTAATYASTILAPAVLFKRTNDIQPSQVECDVYVSGGKVYKGQLLVCDFHYNLAAIRIQSDSILKPAIFRALNDVSSINIDSSDHPQAPFQLRRHTNLFKVQSGTKIMILHSSFYPSFSVIGDSGVFRSFHYYRHSCKELYWVDCANIAEKHSGAIINFSGECLGIMFDNSSFLPSNFIPRWWNNYTTKGELCRPWVGVEISNLSDSRLSFLEEIRNTFSDLGTGVVVTKVEKDSPAYSSGLQLKDVIVKCDVKEVESKIEFFERIWDSAGNSVKLTILRATDRQPLELHLSIG
ncbi:hypothetical protein RND81_04G138000 [Saponaria officinalis]